MCLHTVQSAYIQCSMKASIDFDVRGKKPVPDAKMVSVHMLVLGLDTVLEFLNSAKMVLHDPSHSNLASNIIT